MNLKKGLAYLENLLFLLPAEQLKQLLTLLCIVAVLHKSNERASPDPPLPLSLMKTGMVNTSSVPLL
jgi:hypothetical protein